MQKNLPQLRCFLWLRQCCQAILPCSPLFQLLLYPRMLCRTFCGMPCPAGFLQWRHAPGIPADGYRFASYQRCCGPAAASGSGYPHCQSGTSALQPYGAVCGWKNLSVRLLSWLRSPAAPLAGWKCAPCAAGSRTRHVLLAKDLPSHCACSGKAAALPRRHRSDTPCALCGPCRTAGSAAVPDQCHPSPCPQAPTDACRSSGTGPPCSNPAPGNRSGSECFPADPWTVLQSGIWAGPCPVWEV